jgi:hypothetical protein
VSLARAAPAEYLEISAARCCHPLCPSRMQIVESDETENSVEKM